MYELRKARLILGSEAPAGDGTTGAVRCVIEDDQGVKHAAVLKAGTSEEIAAEAIASLLLSGWGVPVPQPYLVARGDELCFASSDVGYPNLKKRLNFDYLPDSVKPAMELFASQLVCNLQSMPLTTACDEAIDNRDRNFGNILWDGEEEAWVDHAYSFGVGNKPNFNKLCAMAVSAGATEEVQRGAIAAAMSLDRMLPNVVSQAIQRTPIGHPEFLNEVREKLSNIGTSLLARFPQPADLFGRAQ